MFERDLLDMQKQNMLIFGDLSLVFGRQVCFVSDTEAEGWALTRDKKTNKQKKTRNDQKKTEFFHSVSSKLVNKVIFPPCGISRKYRPKFCHQNT